ncbi:MAG: 16S rRNA (cytosine(1402)-N(4))-methyltransferase RsmH [Elusimicrobiota bacterium]|jgi:16S rRNA (cytosine1402-N4)-methyltransferase|nr:16S rRNA (cytosine(1402)-N(4))-methyltransferase RsmH [Elusimicrobiota bacterium]
MSWRHIPILARQITELLITKPGGVYIDATLGLGGHTKYFLGKPGAAGIVIGLDKDACALQLAKANVADGRLKAFHASYLEAPRILADLGLKAADGVLFDLGLSSYQLDDAARGFSFMQAGPLDMRFDNTKGQNAADIVNTLPADELENIILKYGEERAAAKISLAICAARKEEKINTTTRLASVIERVCPRSGKTHPATKTFQALRIFINGELEAVEAAPKMLDKILAAGGRAAFLTFHSAEDRIIKYALKDLAASGNWRLVNKKVIEPAWEEVKANPRARSAKLRVIERLA